MKRHLLSVSIALPMLISPLGESLTSFQFIPLGTFSLSKPTIRTAQATLDRQQPPPFLFAARDDKEKECVWLDICK